MTNIRFQMRQFKRCELGIETVNQICGQAILGLYAVTETKTTEGLVKLFESNAEEKFSMNGSGSTSHTGRLTKEQGKKLQKSL